MDDIHGRHPWTKIDYAMTLYSFLHYYGAPL